MKKGILVLLVLVTPMVANSAEIKSYKPPVEDGNAVDSRLDRVEKSLSLLQQQTASSASSTDSAAVQRSTNTVDVDAFATQIKSIRGDIEQLQYDVATLNDKLQKLSADTETRFNELAIKQNKVDDKDKVINSIEKQLDAEYSENKSSDHPTGESTSKQPNDKSTDKKAITVEEEYQAAYSLLKEKNLVQAEAAFQNFIKKQPNHKLAGSAGYWLGELYYMQGEYEKAVVEYLKGYQRNPKGPKAPDNLLKLGTSLAKIEKRREACVTFSKLVKEFPKASNTILQKASDEMKKHHCE